MVFLLYFTRLEIGDSITLKKKASYEARAREVNPPEGGFGPVSLPEINRTMFSDLKGYINVFQITKCRQRV